MSEKAQEGEKIIMDEKVKKHSMLSNYRYIIKPVIKEKPIYLAAMAIKALLFAVMPITASAAGAMVVTMLSNGSRLVTIILAAIAVFAVYGLVCAAFTYMSTYLSPAFVNTRLSLHDAQIYKKGMDIPLEEYEKESMQQRMMKAYLCVNSNLIGLEGMLRDFVTLGENILGVIAYVIIVGGINVRVMLLLLVLAVISAAIWQLANSLYIKTEDRRAKNFRMTRYIDTVVEDTAGGKDVRVFGLSGWLTGKYAAAILDSRKNDRKCLAAKSGAEIAEALLAAARDLICYFYLIDMLEEGMSVGNFVFCIGLVSGFAAWVAQIAKTYSHCRINSEMVDNLRDFMNSEEDFKDEGAVPEEGFDGIEIEFEHVSYTYPDANKEVLSDVSFRLKKGGHLALVGLNGAGKSTIVKLISGLYLPTSGRVLVNGVDTKVLNRARYVEHEAAIFQNAYINSYTIGENIALSEEWDEKRALEAAEKAGFAAKLSTLKDGFNTYLRKDVSDSGINLSGGEVQKLMLARVLYRDAALVLLDEPTAALDALAEDHVYNSYNETLADKTVLFISHRLASTRFCDSIIMLDKGRIAEMGTHDELMERKGLYAQLFEVQSKYYREGSSDEHTEE